MKMFAVAAVALAMLSGFPALFRSGHVMAQDMVLTKACEAGFRRFIRMAQEGRLGPRVSDASVAARGDHAQVELVGGSEPARVLILKPKRTAHSIARWFDVEAGPNATADDVARAGAALDEAFDADPFEILGLEVPPAGGASVPGIGEAWAYGGWRAVLDALERRLMVLASLEYTIAAIAALGLATLATLGLLWGSMPPARETR